MRTSLTILLTLLVSATPTRGQTSRRVVSSEECANISPRGEPFMLILKRGEEVLDSLDRCAKAAQLKGGMISGLGAIEGPELGFFDLKKSRFTRRRFAGMFEVLAVSGNFSRDRKELTTHIHVSLGRSNFRVIGGHLFDAKVAVTMELFIVPLGEMPVRTMNPELGLKLIDPDPGAQPSPPR